MEYFQKFLEILQNIGPYVAAVNAVLLSLIGFFLLVPGDQPEKFMQSIVDFLAKFSKK